MDFGGDWHGPQGYRPSTTFSGQEELPQQRSFHPQQYGVLKDHLYYIQSPPSDQIQHTHFHQHSDSSYVDPSGFESQQSPPVSKLQAPTVPLQKQEPQLSYGRRWPPDAGIAAPSAASMPTEQPAWLGSAPPPYLTQTPLPIAVPQMSKGKGVPFQRLYAPILQEYGILEREFVDFIDRLNVVSAASPPFKVLDLAGGVVGMVPHHWAQVASNVMKLAAMGGTAIVSKSRTDAFLFEVNQNIFGPRRLRIRLVTSDALLATISFPREKAITLPLNANVPLDQQPTFHTRLLQGLRGYVSDTIPTSLPSMNGEGNMLDKLSADQVSRDIQKIDKKIMKESEKQMNKSEKQTKESEKKMKHKKSKHQNTPDLTDGFEADGIPHIHSKSLRRKIHKIDKEAKKKLDSGKSSAAQIEEERTEALSQLLNKKEQETKHDRHHHEKPAKKGADDKFMEKLLWIFIDRVSNGLA